MEFGVIAPLGLAQLSGQECSRLHSGDHDVKRGTEAGMFITDAQVHIWTADSPERPWIPGGIAQREVPLGAPELVGELDAAGVSRCVLVPPSWMGVRSDVSLEAAASYPGRFGVMALVDVRYPDAVELSNWLEQPNMLGVRLVFTRPGADEYGAERYLYDGTAEWLFSQAEAFGIPVMIWSPGQSAQIGEVARQHPGLKLIVDHLNLSNQLREPEIGAELEKVLPVSEFPNIAIKISALPALVSEQYPFSCLHPHIRSAIDAFGVERCMWGSDYSRLPCPYGDWVRAFTEGIDYLSETEKAQLMGGTLAEWLNWPEPSGSK